MIAFICADLTQLCVFRWFKIYRQKPFLLNSFFVSNMFMSLYLNGICILYVLHVAVVITMQSMQILCMIIFCTYHKMFIIEILILIHVRQIFEILKIYL